MSTTATLGTIFGSQAVARRDAPFIVFPGQTVTYGEAFTRAQAIALALINRGIKPGDHVAVLMPNCIEAALIFLGTHLAGAVAVPINARFKRRELSHVIVHSDSRILFTTNSVREHVDFVKLVWDALPSLRDHKVGSRLSLSEAPRLETIVVAHGAAPEQGITLDGFLAQAALNNCPQPGRHRRAERARDFAHDRRADLEARTSLEGQASRGCFVKHDAKRP